MNAVPLRLALFADSFHEVNGVALTCRQWEAYARKSGFPLLSVHAGPTTRTWQDGSVTRLELETSAWSLGVETDLRFDLLCTRHFPQVLRSVMDFQPDVIHITGPSHLGLMGARAASKLGIPWAASWHTNLHEYAGRRLAQVLPWPPAVRLAEQLSLSLVLQLYRRAGLTFAPNPDLIELIKSRTGRACLLMRRGVDCDLFHPDRRTSDGPLTLGYVGRLSPEKNVQLFVTVEQALEQAGIANYRFRIVGHGSEEAALRQSLRRAEFCGVLKGEALAEAYAGMDVFLFPSETDTYGNVVQEAMASGVPCVVTNHGGPSYLVSSGVDGFVTRNSQDFCDAAVGLTVNTNLRAEFSRSARQRALEASWDSVFHEVYRGLSRLISTIKKDVPLVPSTAASVPVGNAAAGSGFGRGRQKDSG